MKKRFMFFGDNTNGEVFNNNGLFLRLRKIEMTEQEVEQVQALLDNGRLGSFVRITGGVTIVRVEDDKTEKKPEAPQQQ
jgi:hypothetical protein